MDDHPQRVAESAAVLPRPVGANDIVATPMTIRRARMPSALREPPKRGW